MGHSTFFKYLKILVKMQDNCLKLVNKKGVSQKKEVGTGFEPV